MLHVLESPSGPPNCTEYFYDQSIEVKNHIALVESEGAKTFLYHLGFRYLGNIESESELDKLLKSQDPNAVPGDATDVNYPSQPKLTKTVDINTVIESELDKKESKNPDLPATEEVLERWWDN